jgi:hypothetical protein
VYSFYFYKMSENNNRTELLGITKSGLFGSETNAPVFSFSPSAFDLEALPPTIFSHPPPEPTFNTQQPYTKSEPLLIFDPPSLQTPALHFPPAPHYPPQYSPAPYYPLHPPHVITPTFQPPHILPPTFHSSYTPKRTYHHSFVPNPVSFDIADYYSVALQEEEDTPTKCRAETLYGDRCKKSISRLSGMYCYFHKDTKE